MDTSVEFLFSRTKRIQELARTAWEMAGMPEKQAITFVVDGSTLSVTAFERFRNGLPLGPKIRHTVAWEMHIHWGTPMDGRHWFDFATFTIVETDS